MSTNFFPNPELGPLASQSPSDISANSAITLGDLCVSRSSNQSPRPPRKSARYAEQASNRALRKPVLLFSQASANDIVALVLSPMKAALLILAATFCSVLLPAPARAQQTKASGAQGPVTIRSVRAIPENGGVAVEIISSRPLVPAISKLEEPSRLVIDLHNARLAGNEKAVDFRSDQVNGVRMNQFQENPPVARIVVDLAKPVAYTWDAAGNRLMIRLHAAAETSTSTLSLTREAQPGAVALRSASPGIMLAGNRVLPGSSVTAGFDAAVLHLARGGEVRVCPGTTVSVTSSPSGSSLMVGMNTGAIETHYGLNSSSDSIQTPDLRILLAGPGEFHYGITADSKGNTCIQPLPGNTASLIVSEVLGDGTYQVKPAQQVTFHGGHVSAADSVSPASCGCPPDLPAMLKASETPSLTKDNPSHLQLASGNGSAGAGMKMESSSGREPAVPPSNVHDFHVQVEAPFVFSARPPAASAPISEAKLLPLRDLPHPTISQTAALPPARPMRRGFFGKIKGFFAAIFG
jgi:hypothetical protein